ncbi:MAG: sigma-70 family RNA polymerase sigma factor [Gemmatimonadota bacterium]
MTFERLRAGDPDAFRALVDDTWPGLVRHLEGVSGSADAAQDAAQEALVRFWEHRERWQGDSPRALLYRIARNVALDGARRSATRARLSPTAPLASPAPPVQPDEALAWTRLQRRVRAAISALPERRRAVFELVRDAGLTHAEVAEALELAPQTVANHLSLALRDLRSALRDLVDESAESPDRTTRSNDG